jgi:hypothetical protein
VTEPELLDLAGLAARWNITEYEARRVVSRKGVPFIRVSAADDRINWKKVRFRLQAIREWEDRSQERFASREEQPAKEKNRTPLRSDGPSLLGNWRRPAPPAQPREDPPKRSPKRKTGAN